MEDRIDKAAARAQGFSQPQNTSAMATPRSASPSFSGPAAKRPVTHPPLKTMLLPPAIARMAAKSPSLKTGSPSPNPGPDQASLAAWNDAAKKGDAPALARLMASVPVNTLINGETALDILQAAKYDAGAGGGVFDGAIAVIRQGGGKNAGQLTSADIENKDAAPAPKPTAISDTLRALWQQAAAKGDAPGLLKLMGKGVPVNTLIGGETALDILQTAKYDAGAGGVVFDAAIAVVRQAGAKNASQLSRAP